MREPREVRLLRRLLQRAGIDTLRARNGVEVASVRAHSAETRRAGRSHFWRLTFDVFPGYQHRHSDQSDYRVAKTEKVGNYQMCFVSSAVFRLVL